MNSNVSMKTGTFKVIYIYTINDGLHDNRLKIGDASLYIGNESENPHLKSLEDLLSNSINDNGLYTSDIIRKAAIKRINQQTKTADVEYELLGAYLALRPLREKEFDEEYPKDMTRKVLKIQEGRWSHFRDYAVHDVLIRSGISKNFARKDKRSGEWFETDFETVIKAIKAVVKYESSISNETFHKEIVFRPEQKIAINKTKHVFKDGSTENPKHFLWNAIMRFGKTLSSYGLVKELEDVERVLILTHRPVVLDGWSSDFNLMFDEKSDWRFYSKKMANKLDSGDYLPSKSFYFASVQDLRGSFTNKTTDEDDYQEEDWDENQINEVFTKNKEIFETTFDLVILDEAHEGLKTELAERMFDEIKSKYYLRLSGTPFNIIDDFDERNTFTWSYIDEQKAKKSWDTENPGEPNPYEDNPEIVIKTYKLDEMFKNNPELSNKDIYFDFKKFFEVDTEKTEEGKILIKKNDGTLEPKYKEYHPFKNPDTVYNLLSMMTDSKFKINPLTGQKIEGTESTFPFSSTNAWIDFADTFWVLPTINSTIALHEMIKSHPNFSGVEVVNASGSNDNGDPLGEVRKAIKNNSKTITLSIGKLTTGTTVKEWTAVFMLSNMKSATNYMQTIFRSKTAGSLRDGRAKEKAFVFDFAPNRTLEVIIEVSKNQAKSQNENNDKNVFDQEALEREELDELLKYLPVIAYDGSRFEKANSNLIMETINRIYIKENIQQGFSSLRMFNKEFFEELSDSDLKLFEDLSHSVTKKSNDKEVSRVEINANDIKQKQNKAKNLKNKSSTGDTTPPEENSEEKKAIADLNKQRRNMALILRGVATRIPLMVLGAPIRDSKGNKAKITVDNFADLVDDDSWNEFMPRGFLRYGKDKPSWESMKKFFNKSIFEGSVNKIQEDINEIHSLTVLERIPRLAKIFSTFRNPDKETILTPWRVVNMQYSNTLGGLMWVDEDDKWFASDGIARDLDTMLNLVDLGEVEFAPKWIPFVREVKGDNDELVSSNCDNDVWGYDSTHFDINSKTALYPLYAATSLWWKACERFMSGDDPRKLDRRRQDMIWKDVVENQVFVNCRVKYSTRVAEVVLRGYDTNVNTQVSCVDVINLRNHFKEEKCVEMLDSSDIILRKLFNPEMFSDVDKVYERLMQMDKTELKELEKIASETTMPKKFTAIVSNPPYQDKSNSAIFHLFQIVSLKVASVTSFVYPGEKWIKRAGKGAGLDEFSMSLLNSRKLKSVIFYNNAKDIFPHIDFEGGVSFVTVDEAFDNGGAWKLSVKYDNVIKSKIQKLPGENIVSLDIKTSSIIDSVRCFIKEGKTLADSCLPINSFNVASDFAENNGALLTPVSDSSDIKTGFVKLLTNNVSGTAGKSTWFWIKEENLPVRAEVLDKWKVVISSRHTAGFNNRSVNGQVLKPGEAFGGTRLCVYETDSEEEANNFFKWMNTDLVRFLVASSTKRLKNYGVNVPLLDSYKTANNVVDFTKTSEEINEELFTLYGLTSKDKMQVKEFVSKLGAFSAQN